MKMTPLEIKSQEFGKSFRGYDPFEVDTFLDSLATQVEELSRENSLLREKISSLEEKTGEYKRMEDTFQEMLLTTQKSTEEIKKNAQKESDLVIREAKVKADKMLEETHQKLSELRKELVDLKSLKRSFILKLKSTLQVQEQLLEEMEKEESSLPKLRFSRKEDLTEDELDQVVEEFKKEQGESPEMEK